MSAWSGLGRQVGSTWARAPWGDVVSGTAAETVIGDWLFDAFVPDTSGAGFGPPTMAFLLTSGLMT
jgi:hypothetical protein